MAGSKILKPPFDFPGWLAVLSLVVAWVMCNVWAFQTPGTFDAPFIVALLIGIAGGVMLSRVVRWNKAMHKLYHEFMELDRLKNLGEQGIAELRKEHARLVKLGVPFDSNFRTPENEEQRAKRYFADRKPESIDVRRFQQP